ncbi:hypothetical protein DHW03_10090 [Pedobacter yonginense]|uniref:Nucleotide exchange factor GrpE n=1 Tax=Pedobacter yonginense TaxID=651869 RepID=A0A317EM05_9SPHI|nr:hypothetical protein [Pedobacter yonginense]PWS27910.1 hypothetical protein DHW03_10090 [Pedobacter yonginense]
MKDIITQIFEIENKIKTEDFASFKRNFQRIYHELEQEGYIVVNPLHQPYDERDASVEANILNESGQSLKITKVLKPTIYKNENGNRILIQKAVVIVE